MSSKEKILQTARRLFYHVGYQATSVDDILQECGVAKSNFYYHFKTKEQLAHAVLEMRIIEQEAILLKTLQNADLPPQERLAAFFQQTCGAYSELQLAGCPFGNFAAALPTGEADGQHEGFRLCLSGLFHRMEAAIRDCLAEGTAQGAFRADIAPDEMAAFVMAAIQGLLILSKTHRDVTPLIKGLAVTERLLRVR